MKNLLIFLSLTFTLLATSATVKEELIVLSCSGEENGMNLSTLRMYEKKFQNVVIKVRKVGGEIVGVVVGDEELTKEQRATNPNSPNFHRWFEETSDGILTYGKTPTEQQPAKWNIKLSSQGEFERRGAVATQKGSCIVQQKAF